MDFRSLMARQANVATDFGQQPSPHDVISAILKNPAPDSLRPKMLADFIGQRKVVEQLRVITSAAKERGEPAPHIVMSGDPGLGKTSLALAIAAEMGARCIATTAPTLTTDSIGKLLSSIPKGTVVFLDEGHRIGKHVEELIYSALEDGFIDTKTDIGPVRRMVEPFTLILATSLVGKLSQPFRDRFDFTARLEYYDPEDLTEIVLRAAKVMDVSVTAGAAQAIAYRSRGVPRVANAHLRRVRDYAVTHGHEDITEQLTEDSFEFWGFDQLGLDRVARDILKAIVLRYRGGPVGGVNIAIAVGEDEETIAEAERYMIRINLLARTPRGRIVTELGKIHARDIIAKENNA